MRGPLMILIAIFAIGPSQAQQTAVDAEASALETTDTPHLDAAMKADALKMADEALVDAAMKRTEEGAATEELERMPLPDNGPFTAIDYALSFPSAWTNRPAKLHEDGQAVTGVQMLASYGGDLYYSEWACETGKEFVVAAQVIGLFPRVVTKYLERMLLRSFTLSRHISGFDNVRRCDRDKLATARKYFEIYYIRVSKLAIMASESP